MKSYSDIVKGARGAQKAQTQRVPPTAEALSPSLPTTTTTTTTTTNKPTRPPLLAAFPPLGTGFPSSPDLQLQGYWAGGQEKGLPTPAETKSITAEPAAEMAPREATVEDFRISPGPPQGAFPSSASAHAGAPTTVLGPNAGLWYQPKNADLVVWCKGIHWDVHRSVLGGMSEWMEKYMPPAAENGEPVAWILDSWDVGVLGAVLRYIYLEDYDGGYYNPKKPIDTMPIVNATATFLAGAGALVRPMMDHALTNLEAAAEEMQKLEKTLRGSKLDEFESNIRLALLMMYDQPDQWTIRALRIVMGKLMAVCFPFILQSPRWSRIYQPLWGILRVHVVVDHKWLSAAEQCCSSDIISSGFEHMDVLWVKYRGKGWLPSDDLMFPKSEVANLPAPPDPPLKPAGGRKKSRAIPIVRPGDKTVVRGRGNNQSAGIVQPAASKGEAKEKKEEVKTPEQAPVEPGTKAGSSPVLNTKTTAGSTGTTTAVAPDKNAQPGSAAWWAYISTQPYPALFPAPFFVRPTSQSWPGSPERNVAKPFIPGSYTGGPYFFPESSTGVPSEAAASEVGYSSSNEELAAAPPEGSSTDNLNSPTRRMAKLDVDLDEPLGADIPVAPAGTFGNHYSELYKGLEGIHGVRATAAELNDYLFNQGMTWTSRHAGRTQHELEEPMRSFRAGESPTLIATGTSAQGQSDDDLTTPRAPTFGQALSNNEVGDEPPSPSAGSSSKDNSTTKLNN